jgi:LmbE family N-acetylglucosaminyl deacetylase
VDFAPDGPAVVLSPHPDDAVLSAWSVLRAPGELTVVNVFAGVPDVGLPRRADRLVRATDSRAHVRARLAEDREALALAGRTSLNLDFLDEQHRHADPEAAELEAELTEQLPQASALYAPAGIRGDRDHELVRDIALDLGRRNRVRVVLYAELPQAVHYGWPAWVTGDVPDETLDPEVDWELALGAAAVDRDSLVPAIARLEPPAAAEKLRALGCYRSRFSLLNRGPLGLLDHPRVLPFEVSWSTDGDRDLRPVS